MRAVQYAEGGEVGQERRSPAAQAGDLGDRTGQELLCSLSAEDRVRSRVDVSDLLGAGPGETRSAPRISQRPQQYRESKKPFETHSAIWAT